VRAVIAEKTADGAPVYVGPQDRGALAVRLDAYHAPFHAILNLTLTDTVKRFGRALLLDLHSFMGPIDADICIGDRWGTTCSADISDAFDEALSAAGFDVVRNTPFTGGYIVRKYAGPPTIEALQLELRYTNYLDCVKIDEPGRPELESARLSAAQARLRPALSKAIAAFISSVEW